ncbi:MAG: 30S ribosomal protein S12 methylthiotransferase RimO [Bacteroidales bacterium]|jgi:ribosomal protein S12 methylthiotransferase|nr:30S ribosomal protein S12 methylthiotransferase RimO [Bacteroidales bacterium]
MATIRLISLGCSKNTVDSEVITGNLKAAGHDILDEHSARNPQVVIINTCGFIGDAKEESINHILQSEHLRNKHRIEKLVVMGCLVQRHKDELVAEFPSVDAWFGVHEMHDLLQFLSENIETANLHTRLLSTPSHYAYLKIAEGCDRSCSFCAIPLIRGAHVSRPMEDIIEEAKILAEKGVKEIILISQDVTYYGMDLYKSKKIAELTQKISQVDGIEWVRLNYLYPHQFPMDLLDVMAENPKVCQYIDIPLQHISTRILQSMKRASTKEETYNLIETIRKKLPNAALRTTLIVGYPGETEAEFEELKTFVTDVKFDRLGVFKYSPEEGTAAFELDDDVADDVKQARMDEIMEMQQDISLQKNQAKVGRTLRILTDRFEGEYVVGRTMQDSPEVDNEVLILDENDDLDVGEFYNVEVTEADAFDVIATIC